MPTLNQSGSFHGLGRGWWLCQSLYMPQIKINS